MVTLVVAAAKQMMVSNALVIDGGVAYLKCMACLARFCVQFS